jgi:hypothetical protein
VNSSDFGAFKTESYPYDRDFSPLEELPIPTKFGMPIPSKGVLAEHESLSNNIDDYLCLAYKS